MVWNWTRANPLLKYYWGWGESLCCIWCSDLILLLHPLMDPCCCLCRCCCRCCSWWSRCGFWSCIPCCLWPCWRCGPHTPRWHAWTRSWTVLVYHPHSYFQPRASPKLILVLRYIRGGRLAQAAVHMQCLGYYYYYYMLCSQRKVPEHSNCRLVPYWREFLGVSGSRTWSDTPFANT